MFSEGHIHADHYTIGKLWSEARIVRQREAGRVQRDAAVLQMAIGSNLSKKAGKQLNDLLDRIADSD